jgi:hypothetical protein
MTRKGWKEKAPRTMNWKRLPFNIINFQRKSKKKKAGRKGHEHHISDEDCRRGILCYNM